RLLAQPTPQDRDDVIRRSIEAYRTVGSPGFPLDVDAIAERSGREYDRSYDPLGFARQGLAVIASGDRTARLRELDLPALVIHGSADKMCDVGGGRATAAAIRGAELWIVEG